MTTAMTLLLLLLLMMIMMAIIMMTAAVLCARHNRRENGVIGLLCPGERQAVSQRCFSLKNFIIRVMR